MIRTFFTIIAFLTGVVFLWGTPAVGQSAASSPLSMSSLADLDAAVDLSAFNIPEEAKTAAELLAFVDQLQDSITEPKNQVELMQLMEAMIKTFNEVSDRVLALDPLTAEERDKAIQLKTVALTARSRMDPSAKDELKTFADNLVKEAKDAEAKIRAYQLKLQVLASDGAQNDTSVLEKVNDLADEILKNETDDELQVLGMEVKAQSYLSLGDQDSFEALGNFAATMINTGKSQRIIDKARELKLLSLVMASQKDETKKGALDKYFDELFADNLSPTTRTNVYRLRVQTLLDPQNSDPTAPKQALEVAMMLLKEESEELKGMGIAVKTTALMRQAEADSTKVDEIFKYADEILASAPTADQKEQVVGMKIQAYLIKANDDPKVYDELIIYLDKTIADPPKPEVVSQLAEMKLQLLMSQIEGNPTKIAEFEKAIEQFADMEELQDAIASSRAILTILKSDQLAKNNGTVKELEKILEDVKKMVQKDASLIAIIVQMKDSINTIGSNNKQPKLFKTVLEDFIKLCQGSNDPQLKGAAAPLQNLLELESLLGSPLTIKGITAGEKGNEEFSTEAYKGKVFVVDIWSTQNPEYFESVEDLKELYNVWHSKGLEMIGVNLDQSTQMLLRAIEVFGMPWPVVSERLAQEAGLKVPGFISPAADGTKIVVDAKGNVVLVTTDIEAVKAKVIELFPAVAPAPAKK